MRNLSFRHGYQWRRGAKAEKEGNRKLKHLIAVFANVLGTVIFIGRIRPITYVRYQSIKTHLGLHSTICRKQIMA